MDFKGYVDGELNELFGWGTSPDDRDFMAVKKGLANLSARNKGRQVSTPLGNMLTFDAWVSQVNRTVDSLQTSLKSPSPNNPVPPGANPMATQTARQTPQAVQGSQVGQAAQGGQTGQAPQAGQPTPMGNQPVRVRMGKLMNLMNQLSLNRPVGQHPQGYMKQIGFLNVLKSKAMMGAAMTWDEYSALARQSGLDPVQLYRQLS